MAEIKLDLHDIYNKGYKIDTELNRVMHEATDKRITPLEIIPGKGSGQLKKTRAAVLKPARNKEDVSPPRKGR